MASHSHGPWVDVHSHPGRCFLAGLPDDSLFVQFMGPDNSVAQVASATAGEVAVVNTSTVADLAVIGLTETGGLGAVREFEPGEALSDHERQLTATRRLIDDHDIVSVLTPADIAVAAEGDRPGAFVSCEGADFLDGDFGGLDYAYEMGVRAITLVHYRINELGDIQTEKAKHGGLTGFGREVVAEMNRLGMIVDLAHATFETTVGALETSTKPVMISHSHLTSERSDHPRLLSAEHASMVADAGGLVGAWPSGVVQETLDDYVDEICRLVDLIGIAHVAIGTDLDANYEPVLTSYEQFPEVAVGLASRGMTPSEIDQVLGGNFVDFFEAIV